MKKLYEWIAKHKVLTAILCAVLFALPLFIVHVLYKWYLGIEWLIPEWESGEVLAYVAGFEAFIGTVFLGVVSLEQSRKADETNKRLSEENNYLQKVMCQKLMPIVKINSVKATRPIKNYRNPEYLPDVNRFRRVTTHNTGTPEEATTVIYVNVDVKEGTPAYFTELSLSVCNISEAIIRHICVDDITICGYKDVFSEIKCSNASSKNGVSSLFSTDDLLKVQVRFYFNSEEIKSCWDSELGGLAVSMFLTNTTITGIKFQEFMDIRVGNDGYSRISYGEGVFQKEGEDGNA